MAPAASKRLAGLGAVRGGAGQHHEWYPRRELQGNDEVPDRSRPVLLQAGRKGDPDAGTREQATRSGQTLLGKLVPRCDLVSFLKPRPNDHVMARLVCCRVRC